MALLDDEQDPAHAAAAVGATVPDPKQPPTQPPAADPTAGMDPASAQKYRTMKAFLGMLPKSPAAPPPQMPSTIDPSIAKAAQDRLGTLAGIQGIVGLRTVTPYDVKQGIRPSVQSSPGYEAAVRAANLPVEQEQARVAASGKNADIYNKWVEAQAGRESKGSIADVAALAKYLGTEASQANAQTSAGARIGAATISAGAKTESAQIGAKARIDAIKAQLAAGTLTPDAIDRFANEMNTTGQLPRLPGRGPAVTAQGSKIANLAAEKAAASDAPTPLAGAAADYKAGTAAQTSLVRNDSMLRAFKGGALKNLDLALQKAKDMGLDTGSPFFNRPLREYESQFAGDPRVTAFRTARTAAMNEISKVLSSSTGAQAVTDTARSEAMGLLPENATMAQMRAASEILHADADNRTGANADTIRMIKQKYLGGATSGKVTIREKATGTTRKFSQQDATELLKDPGYEQVGQ